MTPRSILAQLHRALLSSAVDTVLGDLQEYDYEYFGLRRETYQPRDGSKLTNSVNHETNVELDGTSAIAVRANRASIERAFKTLEPYMGKWIVLLGSDQSAGSGEDPGEILLRRPIVLRIMEAPVEFVAGAQKR